MPEINITEFDKDTLVVLPASCEKKYVFTVEEALEYIVVNNKFYFLKDLIRKNIPIRDAIRRHGARVVADQILQYNPANDKLRKEMDDIVSDIEKTPIADFDIQVLPVTAELRFLEKQVTLMQLRRCTEITRRIGRWTDKSKRKDETLHVAQIYAPYPCFDSYDYATETRAYNNYFVRDHEVTEDYCLEIENNFHGRGICFASDNLQPQYLPVVYRDDGFQFMCVATAKNNPQVTPAELLHQISAAPKPVEPQPVSREQSAPQQSAAPQPDEPTPSPVEPQPVSREQSAPQVESTPRSRKNFSLLTLFGFGRKK